MFKKLKDKIIWGLVFSLLSLNAMCDELNYNYIQVAYNAISVDPDGLDFDGNGLAVSGLLSVNNNVSLTAGFEKINFDRVFGIDFETVEISFGVITHLEVSSTADVFAGIDVINREAKASNDFTTFSEGDSGNRISIGIRNKALKNLEFDVSIVRTDVFDESILFFVLGAQLYINNDFSLGLVLSTSDEEESLLFNFRADL